MALITVAYLLSVVPSIPLDAWHSSCKGYPAILIYCICRTNFINSFIKRDIMEWVNNYFYKCYESSYGTVDLEKEDHWPDDSAVSSRALLADRIILYFFWLVWLFLVLLHHTYSNRICKLFRIFWLFWQWNMSK